MADLLPDIALSVRQPWAWAIIYGGKDVENRTTPAVTKGEMKPAYIAVHASKGMTRGEYEFASTFMAGLGVACPLPAALAFGAIIGRVTVLAVIDKSSAWSRSPWFFGPRGLLLKDPRPVDPVPAVGHLGYFKWRPSDTPTEPLPWMRKWGKPVQHAFLEPGLLFNPPYPGAER